MTTYTIQEVREIIKNVSKERDDYKFMYERLLEEHYSLVVKLAEEEQINDWYRLWFKRNQRWTDKHNQENPPELVDGVIPVTRVEV